MRLPFHLSTGGLFRVPDPDDSSIELWLRNKVVNPSDGQDAGIKGAFRAMEIARENPDDLLTDALIVNRSPNLRDGEFEAVKEGNNNKVGPASLSNSGYDLLNEVIAAHLMVRLGPYVAGLGHGWPRMLTKHEIYAEILLEILLVADPSVVIDDTAINSLLQYVDNEPLGQSGSMTGDIVDYTPDQLEEIRLAVPKIRAHAFYELKVNAIAAMLRGDSIVAIVLACASLEGAHGAFLTSELERDFVGDASAFNRYVSGLLREQGFYSLVQLSVNQFLSHSERPSKEILDSCLEGVTIRNAIMHAGRRKSGNYKLREYTSSQVNNGYKGIMALYRTFEAAVERNDVSNDLENV